MSLNYDRVCRLCLSSRGELLPIFPTTSLDDPEPPILASKIKDCVSVQITKNDELPTNVCQKCVDNVNNWHLFKSVCERTQNKLQSLKKKDGSQLEEVKIKSEPFSDEAYDDGVVIDGRYLESENAGPSSKVHPEGPSILASLGLTPRSDKGVESEKDYDEDEEEANGELQPLIRAPTMPEVSITVMRPTGETLQSRQGIQQLASKDCLVCGRSYRYSHNARRHELSAHNFDRYTNKINKPKMFQMQPKLRPNPFNPKARLMPNPISHKMQLLPKAISTPKLSMPKVIPPKPIPVKSLKTPQNNLPYPLRIKALKDLQIKKKEPQIEPQILKTLLTSKPEVLVSEPEIGNSAPESPETLISEPEIASFQVEAILSEPDPYDQQDHDQVDGGDETNNKNHHYDTVDMESDNEIEIAQQKENEDEAEEINKEQQSDVEDEAQHTDADFNMEESQENNKELNEEAGDEDVAETNVDGETKEDEEYNEDNEDDHEDQEDQEDNEEECEAGASPLLTPGVELNEGDGNTNSNSEFNEEGEEEADETIDMNNTADNEEIAQADQPEYDPNKTYVTTEQKQFIDTYRDIIEQVNTKRCLCCNKEHPRRKSVIQHLQKNGHSVPKHTCYNCVVTFSHIGALLSHMRANVCTDLWKIIYDEKGITDDMVVQGSGVETQELPQAVKVKQKDIFNARSYACKLCPAKYQLKQFIVKHVLDVHEDGQSQIPLVCVHCKSRFKEKDKLKRHVRRGECIIYIICDFCSEKFKNLQRFNDHALAVHAGNCDEDSQNKCVDGRPTSCPICETKVNNYPGLIKHLRVVHGEEKPYFCTNCDAKFEQMNELNKHIYDMHSAKAMGITIEPDMSLVKEEVEEYHYSCTECNAIFETVDAWTDHQVAEHNQVAHHCDQCDKKFLRPSELAEHKNTHLRVKFYPCSVCSNSYSTPQKLAAHVQDAHPGAGSSVGSNAESEFYCEICIRAFKSRQAYSNHMRIHAKVPTTNRKPGERGFAPQIVGKPIKHFNLAQAQAQQGFVFKQNSNVPNAPYSCDICGKGFMHKKNIWKHKKVLHANLLNDKNDSEENTMHASTEDDEYVDENGTILSTPQFDSFNFSNFANNARQPEAQLYTCDVCYGKFSCRDSLRKHKRAKHGTLNLGGASGTELQTPSPAGDNAGRTSCTICKVNFSDKKSYYRHRKNVHKNSVQMCKICGKPLNSAGELYEHLKAAHARELLGYNANQGSSKPQTIKQDEDVDYEGDQDSVEPGMDYQARYPCDACGKQFVGLLALQNHQCINQLSSEPQTFDCEICHKSYTSIAALKSHRGWHLRSPDGKAAANNTGLWMPHHKVTSKVSKHEVVDPSQLAKVQHVTPPVNMAKRKLPPEVEVTIVNPNKKLRSDDSIEMEQQNSVGGVMEDRYCSVCDREFTKRAAYQRHMEEVHQPNSVFCPVCKKSFTRKSTLFVHMKKHYESGEGSSSMTGQMDDEVHACDLCGAQYDNPMALRAHRARHHDEESDQEESEDEGGSVDPPGEFTCGQCGDGVATPRDLIAHRTMHATPTKYFCNVCKVYFARALDLSSHTRARHSECERSAMYPCAMCERSYTNKKSLQRHIEMAH